MGNENAPRRFGGGRHFALAARPLTNDFLRRSFGETAHAHHNHRCRNRHGGTI